MITLTSALDPKIYDRGLTLVIAAKGAKDVRAVRARSRFAGACARRLDSGRCGAVGGPDRRHVAMNGGLTLPV